MEAPEVSDRLFGPDGSHSLRGHQNQARDASGSCVADVLDRVGACHPAFSASLRQPCFEYDPEERVVLPFPPKPEGHSSLTSWSYRIASGALSTFFLVFFVLAGALIKAIPSGLWILWSWATFSNPDRYRPFFEQEKERKRLKTGRMKADISYYAGLVDLGCEEMKVETEDGYILTMQRIVDDRPEGVNSRQKYPVLLLHGLMQGSGTFCVNDESSLAFYLCKAGYDVWLGNHRAYFKPEHKTLKPSDSKFWNYNLRDMAIHDLPAMVGFVCKQTGHNKIGLVAHSQGAGLSLLALSRGQVPELGKSISCVVALTPAIYCGTLLDSFPFAWIQSMSPDLYRLCFGVHAFVPLMSFMQVYVIGFVYGWLGYWVFNFLFSWRDLNWEKRLRGRFFQFSPVQVSAECMRWWLERDGFVQHRCLLPDTPLNWFHPSLMPPLSLYVGGRDKLVDGRKLIKRFEEIETDVNVIRCQIDEDYEHLDCLWSLDCIDRIGSKVKEDIWKTIPILEDVIVPEGCKPEEKGMCTIDLRDEFGSLI